MVRGTIVRTTVTYNDPGNNGYDAYHHELGVKSRVKKPTKRRRGEGVSSSISLTSSTLQSFYQPDGSRVLGSRSVRLNPRQQTALRKVASQRAEEQQKALTAHQRNALEAANAVSLADNPPEWADFPAIDPLYDDMAIDPFASQSHRDDPLHNPVFDILDTMDGPVSVWRKKRGGRTAELSSQQEKWAAQMPLLVNAYLSWEHQTAPQRASYTSCPPDVDAPPLPSENAAAEYYFRLNEVIGNHWVRSDMNINYPSDTECIYPAEALIHHGLLSNAPEKPTWAVSLLTLELYHTQRLTKPNSTVQSFVQALCRRIARRYTKNVTRKFSEAYDVYLAIHRALEKQIANALGHSDPLDEVRSFCPSCTHVVPDELGLVQRMHYSLDGGNSYKRFKEAGKASEFLNFPSPRILSRSTVDEWVHVVKRRVARKKNSWRNRYTGNIGSNEEPSDSEGELDVARELGEVVDSADQNVITKNIQADPTDLADVNAPCVQRWKANADDSKKGMFSCFEESGLFTAVCRHGLLILTCDMVESGELAKYPLAVTAAVESLFEGPNLQGYDIGCSFEKTLGKAELFEKQGLIHPCFHTLPALHGYGHNRLCQLKYQVLYRKGAGLSDFEQCERVFSYLNLCAGVTRHATAFHRHQFLDMAYRQWNWDKLNAIGRFTYEHYKRALSILRTERPRLEEAARTSGFKASTYIRWTEEEHAYLLSIKTEPLEDTERCLYIKRLHDLWKAEEAQEADNMIRRSVPDTSRGIDKRPTIRTQRALHSRVDQCSRLCQQSEEVLRIDRWDRSCPEYGDALKYDNERSYRLALDHLERLVVQRVMELEKCGKPETNYKLREHIRISANTRNATIRKAVQAYNKAAAKAGRPRVNGNEVLDNTFLEEIDLLRDARQDIRNEPWARRQNRQLRDSYYKVERAREEILRLNIEIKRLCYWIQCEQREHEIAIEVLTPTNPSLASEISRCLQERKMIHNEIRYSLERCANLTGYSGPCIEHLNGMEEEDPDHSDGNSEEGEEQVDEVVDGLSRLEVHA